MQNWNLQIALHAGRHGIMYCWIKEDLKTPTDLFPLFIHPDDGVAGYYYCGQYQCIKEDFLPKDISDGFFQGSGPGRQRHLETAMG